MKLLPAAIVAALIAVPAWAQGPQCGDRAELVKQLAERYGESQRAFGIAGDQRLLEVFAADGGGWTILLTGPDGRACLMAAGSEWHTNPPQPAVPDGDPA